ncbi:MAG TPA: peptidase S41 [Cyanobacteria bacterium UBA9971]|nr:peptidase S41 [Cyanobacteria bacterium UBA9971]
MKIKRVLCVTAAFFVLTLMGTPAIKTYAYSSQELYDEVWKLIDTKFVDASQNNQDWHRWRHKYDSAIQNDKDAYVAIETMLASLNDPYTRFLNPEDFADETQSISGTLFGIGVQIGVKDDKLMVIAPIENTPADKAGLKANDLITEINKKSTKGMSVKEAADLIRGEKGTTVTLLIKREGTAEKLYTITRDKIDVKSVSITIPKGANIPKNIGYIRLNSFLSHTASAEIKDALKKLSNKDGYILDIRSNPGGLLTNAITISDMFLTSGLIVSTVDRDGYKETQQAINKPVTQKPLVVLIDGGSASASEILSGALKDNGRAILIGTKSFGKGLVQEINKLPGGAGINITTQKYLTPNGTDINKKGITPDIEVKITDEDIKNKKDRQLEKADEVLTNLIKSKNKSKKDLQVNDSELPIKFIIQD